MNRRDTTTLLTQAAVSYWAHRMFSCYSEFGILSRGKRRLDLLATNTKGHLIGCEIKSCIADYRADKKWKDYRPYVNQFYLVFSESVQSNEKFMSKVLPLLKEHNAGLLVLSESTGYLRVAKTSKNTDVDSAVAQKLFLRMAWRGGESRRTLPRRKRIFLGEKS